MVVCAVVVRLRFPDVAAATAPMLTEKFMVSCVVLFEIATCAVTRNMRPTYHQFGGSVTRQPGGSTVLAVVKEANAAPTAVVDIRVSCQVCALMFSPRVAWCSQRLAGLRTAWRK